MPLLTITKILLSHANHPLATYALMLIRCAEAPLEQASERWFPALNPALISLVVVVPQ